MVIVQLTHEVKINDKIRDIENEYIIIFANKKNRKVRRGML